MKHLDKLIQELIRIPEEKPWLEFKHNNYTPDMIGKDISALANSAALYEKKCAYMLWGVTDGTHELCGTKYDLQSLKKGSQEIGNWLRSLLSPNAEFEFHTANIDGKRIGVLMVYPAVNQTVTFEKIEYIRSGSYTKKLSDFPALKVQLWDKIRNSRFEERYAQFDLPLSDALQLLDYTAYFERKALTLPADLQGIAHFLLEEGLLIRQDNGLFAITNLGAVTLAKKLSHFNRLSRKALRIVQYDGTNRLNILRDETFDKGYISAFDSMLKYMEALIPASEPIIHGLREKQTAYPLLAIRELLANALIHQDFAISGAGPVVEIFKNQLNRHLRVLSGPPGRGVSDICLHRVGQRVHACSRRDKRRETQRDFRVEDGISGDQRKVVDRIFMACLRIGDHGRECCLASRPCGSGDGHEQRQLFDASHDFRRTVRKKRKRQFEYCLIGPAIDFL